LTSVASATATSAVNQHPRRCESTELQVEGGNRQQRRGDARRRQLVGTGFVDEIKWSADRAPISAASCDPPLAASSSAWSRSFMPAARAAVRISAIRPA
jgi:hypothetical protein